jgi:hypothetical protein
VVIDPECRFPFGYERREVSGVSSHGAIQRSFGADTPPDALDQDQLDALMAAYDEAD